MTTAERKRATEMVSEAWGLLDSNPSMDSTERIVASLSEALELVTPAPRPDEEAPTKFRRRAVIGTPSPEIKVFESVQSAGDAMGVHRNTIRQSCEGLGRTKGYFWRFIDELLERRDEEVLEQRDAPIYSIGPSGERTDYPSIQEAARSTGIHRKVIEYALLTGMNRTTGMFWHRAEVQEPATAGAV